MIKRHPARSSGALVRKAGSAPLLAGVLLVCSLGSVGCAKDITGPAHPTDELNFPVAVTADPDGSLVWVTSGNFDLAYNGGAVLAIDVASNTFVPEAAVEVGSYPGPFTVLADSRPVEDDSGATRQLRGHGYVLSRDTNALYHVSIYDEDGVPVSECGGRAITEETGIMRCDLDRTLRERTFPTDDGETTLKLGTEPYASMILPGREGVPDLLITGAMDNGIVSTYTLTDGVPELSGNLDLRGGILAFAASRVTGRVYAASKRLAWLQVIRVRQPGLYTDPPVSNPFLVETTSVAIPATGDIAAYAYGLDVSPSDESHLYASFRAPSSLAIIDISQAESGGAYGEMLTKVAVGYRPGDVLATPATEDGLLPELVYVSCYGDDRVDVIDPRVGEVSATIPTGRGPSGLAFVDNPALGLRRLYVAQFRANSVGVIELDPTSPYFHELVVEVR